MTKLKDDDYNKLFDSLDFCPMQANDQTWIMEWRNRQLSVLRQNIPSTLDEQMNWYSTVGRYNPWFTASTDNGWGETVGLVGLTPKGSPINRDWEVSILVHPSKRMPFLKNVLIDYIRDWAFDHTNLQVHRLTAEVFDLPARNSVRLGFVQSGFTHEGTLKEGHYDSQSQKHVDILLYGLLNTERPSKWPTTLPF